MISGIKERPSLKEIDKRLKEAIAALKTGNRFFANPSKVVGELMSLDLDDTEDVWELIITLLEEIELNEYAGSHPPQKSYESSIAGQELWAFSWRSTMMMKEMYLKFALKEGVFYYVSLHESRK